MKQNNNTKRIVKVGIVAIVSLFLLYFGLNFLKGIDIFSSVHKYYGTYEEIGGLVPSSPVYIKGYKVGQVEEVKYDFTQTPAFTICVSVSSDIQLPQGTEMQLFDDGLMGGKAIQFILPTIANTNIYQHKDTLPTTIAGSLMALLTGDMLPKITSAVTHIDSLSISLNTLLNGDEIKSTLTALKNTTNDLAQSSEQLKSLMRTKVPSLVENVDVVIRDLRSVSTNLATTDLAKTLNTVDSVASNLQTLSTQLNDPNGTLGLLLNDKQLYLNLSNTAASADQLLIDLKENPKRYVHFSLFGRKDKREKDTKE